MVKGENGDTIACRCGINVRQPVRGQTQDCAKREHPPRQNALRALKQKRCTCDMRAKSIGCRLWQQRARSGPALGLRHCIAVKVCGCGCIFRDAPAEAQH
jgi:hypothetical protein